MEAIIQVLYLLESQVSFSDAFVMRNCLAETTTRVGSRELPKARASPTAAVKA
jgi:hypothetical protein